MVDPVLGGLGVMSVRTLLSAERLLPADRRSLVKALSVGPWAWPWDDEALVDRAARYVQPPPLRDPAVGVVPLVTAASRDGAHVGASLWVYPTLPLEGVTRPLGPEAREAWAHAVAAIPRALPLLTDRPRGWDAAPAELACFAMAFGHNIPSLSPLIDGPSFGLGFILALASRLMGQPVPGNLIASAKVGPNGELGEVDGIEWKLKAIDAWAPGVSEVLVSDDQLDVWKQEVKRLGLCLKIKGFSRASTALDAVFGEQVRDRVAKMETAEQGAFVNRMFLLTVGIDDFVDWFPVDEATSWALKCWGAEMAPFDRYRLSFANAVAARHENRRVDLAMPPKGFLDQGKLAPTAAKVIAHLVQHSAEVGSPPVADVSPLAWAWLKQHEDQLEAHRIMGALGRKLSYDGVFSEALDMQMEAAEFFADNGAWADVSFQLSEWYRLAGCFPTDRGHEVFGQADAFARKHEISANSGGEPPFVTLGRARSQVQLGIANDDTAAVLTALAANPEARAHLRYSSLRWLARHERASPVPPVGGSALMRLEHAARNGTTDKQARLFLCLARLDEAVASGHSEDARAFVEELSGYFGLIVAALQNVDADPAFVARAFPY